MVARNEDPCPFADINGLVATFLRDIAEHPVPPSAQARLAQIRKAAAEGKATMDMGLEIVDMFPSGKAAR
jgi:hypothetical protein